ncbi:MAG: thioredoxin, partial [Lapillicoccus sp.]
MATTELTAQSFEQTVLDNGTVFVDFWAEWCGPCQRFGPVYEDVSKQHDGIVFAKVDTEAEQALAAAVNITSIPTLMAFRDGILVFRQAGALPKESLQSLIQQVGALDMDAVRAELADKAAELADKKVGGRTPTISPITWPRTCARRAAWPHSQETARARSGPTGTTWRCGRIRSRRCGRGGGRPTRCGERLGELGGR